MNNADLLVALQRVSSFSLDSAPLDNREEMERVIKSAEQAVDDDSSALFLYWLGVAYRNYNEAGSMPLAARKEWSAAAEIISSDCLAVATTN